jgi:hypothetical protein
MATLHDCYVDGENDCRLYSACGPAVTVCLEREDGSLWAGNMEYTSRVNFCPFCGFRARNQIVFGEQP